MWTVRSAWCVASIPKGPIKPLEMVSAFLPILAHTMGVHRCSAHTWPKVERFVWRKAPCYRVAVDWFNTMYLGTASLQLCGACHNAVPSINNMKRFSHWWAGQMVYASRRIYDPVKDHERVKPLLDLAGRGVSQCNKDALLMGMTYLNTDVGTTRSFILIFVCISRSITASTTLRTLGW